MEVITVMLPSSSLFQMITLHETNSKGPLKNRPYPKKERKIVSRPPCLSGAMAARECVQGMWIGKVTANSQGTIGCTVPLTMYPWYLLDSLGILGVLEPINTHEL